MPLTAAIVEDDPFARTMLVATLRAQGVEVVIETAEPSEALALAPLRRPRVALLDLHLGTGPTGIELAHALRTVDPRIAIVILTSFEDPRLLSTRLPDPPPGSQYLTKGEVASVEVLVRALKHAVEAAPSSGRASPATPPSRSGRAEDPARARVVDLTDSQLETLQLLAQGHSNAQIAVRRSVTERSVETTIGRIARALGLAPDATRNQRVHMARVYLRAAGLQQHDG
jgi:two-component system invasion response regulator UvrY